MSDSMIDGWEAAGVEESSACVEAAALYRGKLGWPCTAHGFAVWTLAGETVDAVDLPDGLVDPDDLPRHGVIEVPGDTWYVRFLVQPGRTTPAMMANLARLGAHLRGHGTVIELPPTRVPGGMLSWALPPDGTLPTLPDLVARMLRSEHKSSER